MRKDIAISISAHLILIVSVVLLGPDVKPAKGYPKIYRVGLVSLPPPGGGGTGEGQVQTKEEKGVKKGIALKETRKKEKSLSQKKSTSKEKASSKKETGSVKGGTSQKKTPGGVGSGSGLSSVRNGGIVGSAQVDGADFGSGYYVEAFVAKINNLWENPIRSASSTLSAIVYFRILKNGDLADVKVERSSGVGVFDKAALRAVVSASPLQPLPDEYTGDYLGVHLEFEFAQ